MSKIKKNDQTYMQFYLPSKFTKDQKVDLIEYLIQIIQIKLINLK